MPALCVRCAVVVACIGHALSIGAAPEMGENFNDWDDHSAVEQENNEAVARALGFWGPSPTTEAVVSGATTTSTIANPAPGETTAFDFVVILRADGCANACNTSVIRLGEDTECSCDEACADGTDAYGTCCNYMDVCLNASTTEVLTTTTGFSTLSTAAVTVPPGQTTALCPATCGPSDNTCDELSSAFACIELENNYACDCNGCACTATTAAATTLAVSGTDAATTPKHSTASVVVTAADSTAAVSTEPQATVATIPATTFEPCPATCFDMTCDDWIPFGGFAVNTRCPYLEKVHECDCRGCICDDAYYSTGGSTEDTTTSSTTRTTTTTTLEDDNNYGIDTAVIGGGYSNTATGKYSVIGGGRANVVTQEYGTLTGGVSNSLRSNYVSMVGGYQNTAKGRFVSIPGGRQNTASGRHSVLLGSAASTTGKTVDHVLLMNFQQSSGALVGASVSTENTISIQADEVHFNDIDVLATLQGSRRLAENSEEIAAAKDRIASLKTELSERLEALELLSS